MAIVLMLLAAAIPMALGIGHLVFTFHGSKLVPRDPALRARMTEVPLGISRHTTMWKAWIGFNASHSLSIILFGLVYGDLALQHPTLLFGSPFLLAVGAGMLGAMTLLARRYWFNGPLIGVGTALGCYLFSVLASLF